MWQAMEIRLVTPRIRDLEAQDLEGVESVIHLAALSNDPLSDLNSELKSCWRG